jgi:uncharacterized protein
MTEEYKKQLPLIDSAMRPFWDGARHRALMVYRCLTCGTYYWPAVDCAACDNPKMEWLRVSGRGYVNTYVVYYQLYHPGWKEEIPYNVSWIKLDEGAILLTNIVGCRNVDIYLGMPVEAVFEDITEEVTLPKFRPAG